MGHSLRPDNLTITPDFVISDGTHNSGYALVSATGGVASWKNISNIPGFTTKHYVGELWGGGVVADVWKENDVEKCLITALSDYSYVTSVYNQFDQLYDYFQNTQHQWSTTTGTGSATSSHNGLANTNYMLSQFGSLNTPSAFYCTQYINPNFNTGTFSDWYLPSLTEMSQVVNNSFKINSAIKKYATDNSKNINAFDNTSNSYVNYISKYQQYTGQYFFINQSANIYWTSTEVMNSTGQLAYSINVSNNTILKSNKTVYCAIRPVRIASETTIITAVEFVKSSGIPNYNVLLTSNISGSGDVFTEIGVCRNGPYSPTIYGPSSKFLNNRGDGAGYGAATGKPAIPLPTINDTKVVATMTYDPTIGFGYGDFGSSLSSFQNGSMYSIRAYAITNKGEVKYGEQLVIF